MIIVGSGYVPYMMAEVGALIIVWVAAYLFRSAVTGDRLWLTIFRFATDVSSMWIIFYQELYHLLSF